jgi:rod shape-determining protein MreD
MNMKSYFILIPIFLFALLQGAFLPLNFVLLTVIFFTVFGEEKTAFLIAFFSGLFLDLAKGIPLGLSAACLLLVSGLLCLYASRFNSRQPLFLAFVSFLSQLFWGKIFQGFWSWEQSLILGGLGLAFGWLLRSFFLNEREIKI